MIFDIPTKIIKGFKIGNEWFTKGQLIIIDRCFSNRSDYERPTNLPEHHEWFEAIFVSNDEKPVKGDLAWNSNGIDLRRQLVLIDSDELVESAHKANWKKILVKPEEISILTVAAIESGFFQHNDYCLLSIEPYNDSTYFKLRFDERSRVIINRLVYNREYIIDKALSYFDAFCKAYVKNGAIDPLKSIEWFDKNVY
jgi:hypothetical protein